MMTEENRSTHSHQRKLLSARRLALLGSVAIIGAAVALGPSAYGRFGGLLWPPAVHASEGLQGPHGFADLVAKVKPAVISVRVKIDEESNSSGSDQNDEPVLPPSMKGSPFEKFFRQFGDLPPGVEQHQIITGLGSGFFISPDGYAVTNNHVVDHAKSVQVATDDGKKYAAKVIGTDPKTDLALIKVAGKDDFDYVKFENSAPRIGDWVVAVGNPFGLGGTVTAGIISAQGRDIGSGAYNYLQIDAPINKGSSGGPTFDMNGDVVGVNTAIYSPSGDRWGSASIFPPKPPNR
jgi:serine protease Do